MMLQLVFVSTKNNFPVTCRTDPEFQLACIEMMSCFCDRKIAEEEGKAVALTSPVKPEGKKGTASTKRAQKKKNARKVPEFILSNAYQRLIPFQFPTWNTRSFQVAPVGAGSPEPGQKKRKLQVDGGSDVEDEPEFLFSIVPEEVRLPEFLEKSRIKYCDCSRTSFKIKNPDFKLYAEYVALLLVLRKKISDIGMMSCCWKKADVSFVSRRNVL